MRHLNTFLFRAFSVRWQRLVASVLLALFLIPTPSAFASIVVDGSSANQATLDTAQNGVDVVNISSPSGAGVSKNDFSDYNVSETGVILNNSTEIGVSQLGGALYANPNFTDQTASLVMFEVTGTDKSNILGFTEMFGDSAEFILANPNGIYVNGAGFINVPRAMFTTGVPHVNSDGSYRYVIDSGVVEIGELGLNASDMEAVDIWARAVELNGELWGGDELSIVTGRHTMDADGTISDVLGSDGTRSFAIDSSRLGGMYAGRIYLMSTEDGVGVNLDGALESYQNGVEITSAGDIAVADVASVEGVELEADGSVVQNGDVSAVSDVSIVAGSDVVVDGALVSDAEVDVVAGGAVAFEEESYVQGTAVGVDAGSISMESMTMYSPGELVLTAEGAIVQKDSVVYSESSVDIDGDSLVNTGYVQSDGRVDVMVTDVDSSGVVVGNEVDILSETVVNSGVVEGSLVGINATEVVNDGVMLGQTVLDVESDDVVNGELGELKGDKVEILGDVVNEGRISGEESVTLVGERLENRGGIESEGAVSVSGPDFYNAGTVHSNLVQVVAGRMENDGGVIQGGTVRMYADEMRNAGYVQSLGDVILRGALLQNLGVVYGQSKVDVDVETLENYWVIDGQDIDIVATQVDSSGFVDGQTVSVEADKVVNSGSMFGAESLDVVADIVTNEESAELKGDVVTVRGDLVNRGLLAGKELVSVDGGRLDNSGSVHSEGQVLVDTGDVYNRGHVQAKQVDLVVDGVVKNIGGGIQTETLSSHSGGGFYNLDGGMISVAGDGVIEALTVRQDKADMVADRWDIDSDQWMVQTNSQLISNGELDVDAGDYVRLDIGSFVQGKDVHISASNGLTNDGDIQGVESVVLDANALENDGYLQSGGDLTFEGGTLINRQMLTAGTVFKIVGDDVQNSGVMGGDLVDIESENLTHSGELYGASGVDLDVDQVSLEAESYTGSDGSIVIEGETIYGRGVVAAKTDVDIDAATFTHTGVMESDVLDVDVDHFTNFGDVYAGTDIDVDGQMVRLLGEVISEGEMTVRGGFVNVEGQLLSGKDMRVHSDGLLRTSGGGIQSYGGLVVYSDSIIDMTGTYVGGSSDVVIDGVQGVDVDGSTVLASGALTVRGDMSMRLSDSLIQAQKTVDVASSGVVDIDNTSLESQAGVVVNSHGDGIVIRQSDVNSDGELRLDAHGGMSISDGAVVSGMDDVSIESGGAFENDGVVQSGGDVRVDVSERVDNRGVLSALNDLTIFAGDDVRNDGGEMYGVDMTVDVDGAFENVEDALVSVTGVGDIDADRVRQDKADMLGGRWDIDSEKTFIQTNSALIAVDGVDVNADSYVRLDTGSLIQGDDVRMSAVDTFTNEGDIVSVNDIRLSGSVLDNKDGGTIFANEVAFLWTDELKNYGGIHTGTNLVVKDQTQNGSSGLLTNRGEIKVLGNAALDVTGLNNKTSDAVLSVAGLMTLDLGGATLYNDYGRFESGKLDVNNGSGFSNDFGFVKVNEWANWDLNGNFDNTDGSVVTLGDLDIDATSILNTGTKSDDAYSGIVVGGDLTMDGSKLKNNNGQLFAAGDVIVDISGEWDNSNGVMESNQSLKTDGAVSTRLTNANGVIQVANGLDITSDEIRNKNGLMFSGGAMMLTTDFMDNQDNDNSEGLQSMGTLRVEVENGDFYNVNGNVYAAGDVYVDVVGDLYNDSGVFSVNGGDIVVRDSFVNDDNGAVYSQENIKMNVGLWNNTDGTVYSKKDLTILSDETINDSGTFTALNDLYIKRLDNSNGVVEAARNLTLDVEHTGMFDNENGVIKTFGADGLLKVNMHQGVANTGGEIFSAGDLELNLLTNQEYWDRWRAGYPYLIYGDIHSNGNTDVNGDVFLFRGDMTTVGTLTTDVNYFSNGGTVHVGSDVLINNGFTNSGDIFAGQDIHIDITGKLGNSGVLRAQRDLYARQNHMMNYSSGGRLEAGRDMTLITVHPRTYEGYIYNYHTLIAARDLTIDMTGTFYNRAKTSYVGRNANISVYKMSSTADFLVDGNLTLDTHGDFRNSARFVSGGDMTLTVGDDFRNSDTIRAQGDITLDVGDEFENVTQEASDPNGLDTIYGNIPAEEGITFRIVIAPGASEQGTGEQGIISAGGDLKGTVRGYINNETIYEDGEDPDIDDETVENVSGVGKKSLSQTGELDTLDHVDFGAYDHGGLFGFNTEIEAQELEDNTITAGEDVSLIGDVRIVIDKLKGFGGLLGLHDSDREGDVRSGLLDKLKKDKEGLDDWGVDVKSSGHGKLSGGHDGLGSLLVNVKPGGHGRPGDLTPSDGSNPTLTGKKVLMPKPKRQYLIETQTDLIDVSLFKGSEYFLDRIGFDQDAILLGDAFYEAKLVQDTIFKETQKHTLDRRYMDDASQLEALYDNAATVMDELELSVGVALTKEQVDALSHDIIWLVKEEVKGHMVYVPKVYLSKLTMDNIDPYSGSIIQGANVELTSLEGDIDNNGMIRSDYTTALTSEQGSITNEGDIEGQIVDLKAYEDIVNQNGGVIDGSYVFLQTEEGDIRNVGSTIKGDEHVALIAEKGDVINFTEMTMTKKGKRISSKLGQRAQILSDGTLAIDAGNDVRNTAGYMSAEGDAYVRAGNDITLDTQALVSRYEKKRKRSYKYGEKVRHRTSTLESGGNLTLEAGNDVNVIGSTVRAAGRGVVQAGNDVNVFGVDNSTHKIKQRTKVERRFLSKKVTTKRTEDYKLRVKEGTLDFGEPGSAIVADGAVNLVGSNLLVGGAAQDLDNEENSVFSLKARDLNVIAMDDETYHKYDKKSSWSLDFGSLGSLEYKAKGRGHSERAQRAVASEMLINGDLDADIENDMVVIGSDITVAGDADLDIGNDLLVLSKEEVMETSSYKDDKNLTDVKVDIDLKKVRAEAGVGYGGTRHSTKTTAVTHRGSEINVGGSLDADVGGNATFEGARVTAFDDLMVDAEGDINVLETHDTVTTRETDSEYRLEVSAVAGNAWVDAANEAVGAANSVAALSGTDFNSNESKIGATVKAFQATIAAAQTARLVESVANSAASAGSFGFYGGVKTKLSSTDSFTETTQETANGSSFQSVNGDVVLDSEKELNIRGAQIHSDMGDVLLRGKDKVTVTSAEDSMATKTGYEHHSLESTVTSAGFKSPSYTDAESSSTMKSVTQRNSGISAANGTFKVVTDGNAELTGVEATAKNVDLTEIGDTLVLSSQQDRKESSSESRSITVGDTMSFSVSQSGSSSSWVNSQSKIIATEQLDVNAKAMEVNGAVIAQVNEDGTDGGNMNINVESLTVTDIEDKDEGWSESYSFSTTAGSEYKTSDANGTTSFGLHSGNHDKRQTTYGTLGQGNVVVAGDSDSEALDGVNRDVAQTQKMTKDEENVGWDMDLTVDHRYVAGGVDAIKEDLAAIGRLPENMEMAGNRVGDATEDLIDSVQDNGLNVVGAYGDYRDDVARNEAYSRMSAEELDVIENPEYYSESDKKAVADKFSYTYAEIRGIDPAEAEMYDAEQISEEGAVDEKGLDKRDMIAMTNGDKSVDEIYYEADRVNEDDNFAQALGHENKRQDHIENDIKNNTTDGRSTKYDKEAIAAGEHSVKSFGRETSYKGVSERRDGDVYVRTQDDWNMIDQGTAKVEQVEDAQPINPWPYVISGGITGAFNYGTQVYQLHQEGKEGMDAWYGDVDFVEVKDSAVNGALFMVGGGVVSNVAKKAPYIASYADEIAHASVSTYSQFKENGEVDPLSVAADVYVGKKANKFANKIIDKRRASPGSQKALRKAQDQSVITNFRDVRSQVKQANKAMKETEKIGKKTGAGTGAVSSGIGGRALHKMIDEVKYYSSEGYEWVKEKMETEVETPNNDTSSVD